MEPGSVGVDSEVRHGGTCCEGCDFLKSLIIGEFVVNDAGFALSVAFSLFDDRELRAVDGHDVTFTEGADFCLRGNVGRGAHFRCWLGCRHWQHATITP